MATKDYLDDDAPKPKKKVAVNVEKDDLEEEVTPKKKSKPVVEEEEVKPKKAAKKSRIEMMREMMAGINDTSKWFKPMLGDNLIRILPDTEGNGKFFVRMNLHYGFKDAAGNKRAYPCLSEFKKPCPVCKVIAHFQDDDDEDIKKICRDLRPNLKFLMNVVDRKDTGLKIFSATPPVLRDLKRFIMDDEVGDITDPVEGRDVVITKEDNGGQIRYNARVRIKATPVGVEDWEDNIYALEEEAYREIPSYDTYVKYLKENYDDVLLNLDKVLRLSKQPRIESETDVEEEGDGDDII